MSEEFKNASHWVKTRMVYSRVSCLLTVVLGFAIFGQNSALKALGPVQGLNPAPAISAPAQPPQPAASPTALISDVYSINPNDILEIDVFDVPELSHTYMVSPSGVVAMPLLPVPVRATGLTPDQFARVLEDAYRQSGRLLRPEIAVSVKQSPTSSIAVEGGVRTPQLLLEIGRVRLVDIITQCGGLTDDAGPNLTITRSPLALRYLTGADENASPTLTIDLKKIMNVNDPASNTAVWPGDRVSVEHEPPDLYYVLGEVKAPGGYTLKKGREELTVLRAVALAGDLTTVAKKNKAIIIRKTLNAPLGREEIKLDLQRILKGTSPDPVLQADDILFVPGSNGKKALHAIEGAPGQALGAAGASALIVH